MKKNVPLKVFSSIKIFNVIASFVLAIHVLIIRFNLLANLIKSVFTLAIQRKQLLPPPLKLGVVKHNNV